MRKVTRSARLGRPPFVAAFGVAFEHGLDPVLGKMMLQERGVEVAAAVFVADGVDGGAEAEGGGREAIGDGVHDFAEEADGDVREGGAFGAVVVDEVVEFGGEYEAGADEEWSDAGGFARRG